MVLLFAGFAPDSDKPSILLLFMYVLNVHMVLSVWLWDLHCVFENVLVSVCLARSFSTLHAGLQQADKLFAKTGN